MGSSRAEELGHQAVSCAHSPALGAEAAGAGADAAGAGAGGVAAGAADADEAADEASPDPEPCRLPESLAPPSAGFLPLSRKSVTYQPVPFSWKAGADNCLLKLS